MRARRAFQTKRRRHLAFAVRSRSEERGGQLRSEQCDWNKEEAQQQQFRCSLVPYHFSYQQQFRQLAASLTRFLGGTVKARTRATNWDYAQSHGPCQIPCKSVSWNRRCRREPVLDTELSAFQDRKQ